MSQDEWLRQHLFNGVGNYLYCQRCILSSFGISSDRISRQRTIVRQHLNNPIVDMIKTEVIEKHVNGYVVMADTACMSFSKW